MAGDNSHVDIDPSPFIGHIETVPGMLSSLLGLHMLRSPLASPATNRSFRVRPVPNNPYAFNIDMNRIDKTRSFGC